MIVEHNDDNPAPDWRDLAAAGHVIKDSPARRVAVFMGGGLGNGARAVILAGEGPLHGSMYIEADEIDAVCAALQALKPEIADLQQKSDAYLLELGATLDAADLMDRLKKGPSSA